MSALWIINIQNHNCRFCEVENEVKEFLYSLKQCTGNNSKAEGIHHGTSLGNQCCFHDIIILLDEVHNDPFAF